MLQSILILVSIFTLLSASASELTREVSPIATDVVTCHGRSNVPGVKFNFTIGVQDVKNEALPLYVETETVSELGNIKWQTGVACEGDIGHEIICGDHYPRFRIQLIDKHWQVEHTFITFPGPAGSQEFAVEWEMIGRRLTCTQNYQVDLKGREKYHGPIRR